MWVTKISTEISIFAIVGYSFHFSFLWADLAASSQAGQCSAGCVGVAGQCRAGLLLLALPPRYSVITDQ